MNTSKSEFTSQSSSWSQSPSQLAKGKASLGSPLFPTYVSRGKRLLGAALEVGRSVPPIGDNVGYVKGLPVWPNGASVGVVVGCVICAYESKDERKRENHLKR